MCTYIWCIYSYINQTRLFFNFSRSFWKISISQEINPLKTSPDSRVYFVLQQNQIVFKWSKHPLFRISSGKSCRDKGPKNTPFPEKMRRRMRPIVHSIRWGAQSASQKLCGHRIGENLLKLHINIITIHSYTSTDIEKLQFCKGLYRMYDICSDDNCSSDNCSIFGTIAPVTNAI